MKKGLTLVELLTVTAIIGVLAAMLLPTFQKAIKKARYARWLGYKSDLRAEPSLIAYYTFEEAKLADGTDSDTARNMATAGGFSKSTVSFSDYTDPEELDGTISDPSNMWTDGRWKGKKALKFDGSNDYVDCGNDASLQIGESITVEAWLYFNVDKSCFIINNYQSAAGKSYLLHADPGGWIKGHLDDGTPPVAPQWQGIELHKWYHVVLVRDYGKTAKIYVDGKEKVSVNDTAGNIASDKNLMIGRRSSSSGEYFNGLIGEVAIYNRALSAEEIESHYRMGRP